MRKITALVLTVAFVLVSATSGFALDYRQAAINYLSETLKVPAERIDISEGYSFQLEYVKETFWSAKYVVYAEGVEKPVPPTDPVPPEEDPETPKAEPDTVTTEPEPTTDPAPPVDSDTPDEDPGSTPGAPATRELAVEPHPASGETYGVIYIREKTGEFLTQTEMDFYFQKDGELAQAAWQQLEKEAGKLDVNLYIRLKELAASEKVAVNIVPVFVETSELTQRYLALKAEYPEQSEGMLSLSEMFGNASYGVLRPEVLIQEEAVSSPLVDPQPRIAVDLPASEGGSGSMPAYEDRPVANDQEDEKTDPYWQKFQEFQEKLEVIRLDGLQASISAIESKLAAMNVTFKSNNGVISAELTKDQMNDVAALSEVQTIFDDMYYALEMRNTAADSAAALMRDAKEETANTAPSVYLLLLVLPAAAAVVFYRKRFVLGK